MGTLLFRLCIYKLIWREKNLNFKKQNSEELHTHIHKDTGYFNILAVFILQKSSSCCITVSYCRNLAVYSSLALIYLTSIRENKIT